MRFSLLKSGRFWLWLGILLVVLSHYGVSNIRYPYPAAAGNQIHAPQSWKASNTDRIRVSTYNIHRGEGEDGVTDLGRTASLMKEDDIAGLQEVFGARLFSRTDQAEQLAEILNTGWLYAPIQKRYYQSYIGNALLSRFPVHSWERRPLIWSDELGKSDRSRRYRNMILADMELSGKPVKLLITHLDRGAIRQTQLASVLQQFDQYDRVILLGDLNTKANDEVMSQWLSVNPETDAIATALGERNDQERIDWILTKGFKVLEGGMEPVGISDHPYYWVSLQLLP